MGKRTSIAAIIVVAVLAIVVAAAYAYDSSQKDKIADGVTVGGVDVGGMSEAEAKREVSRRLLGPLKHSLRVGYADATHFIRMFRREHGATPTVWRASVLDASRKRR